MGTAALALVLLLGAPPPPLEAPLAELPPPAGEDIRALIDGAGGTKDNGGADAVVVLDRTTVQVEESGLAHYRHRRIFKVLTEEGATSLASLRFDYDPASNFVEVRTARRYPARLGDEPPAEPVDLDTTKMRDLPQPQHWIYWGPRMKVLPIPRLAVGDALEVETYKKGFIIAYLGGEAPSGAAGGDDAKYIPPMRGHFYDLVLFGSAPMPVLEQRYEVTLPRDKPLQFEVYNGEVVSGMTFDQASTTYTFAKRGLPAHEPEPRAADASDYLPKVVMSTVPDWEAKSRWFAAINEGQFASTPEIDAKVAEILRGAGSDEEKISRILHWTAQEIRYSGITMGKGEGYTLHSGAMTFKDRAGVCKDIAGMSITLLRAAGFKAYPAMTMAGARVERVPADQFNHCVVAVERPEGFRMIDPTWAPFSAELWSSAEREQHYVVGSPEGETLMKTPYLPPEHNRLTIVAASKLDAEGNLTSEVKVSGSGYVDDRLRRQVAYRDAAELGPSIAAMLTRVAPTAVLEDLRFGDHRDLKTPFTMTLRYRVPRYAIVADGVMRTGIPAAAHLFGGRSFADWLSATETATRQAAIWLRSPQLVTFDERIELPRGAAYRLVGPGWDESRKNDMASVRARLRQEGNTLKLDETIRIMQRNVAPKDYAALKAVVDVIRELGGRRVYLEAKGGRR